MAELAKIEMSVPGMVCEGCAEKIRNALTAIPGVREVKPKLWRKQVEVRYEPAKVQDERLKEALGVAGFAAAGQRLIPSPPEQCARILQAVSPSSEWRRRAGQADVRVGIDAH